MFSSKIGKGKLSVKKEFAVTLPKEAKKWDDYRSEIVEAFHTLGGVRGIMGVTGLRQTQAYLLAAKFGLIIEKAVRRNSQVYARRRMNNLEHLRNVWGWRPGDDTVTLKNGRHYAANRSFMAGRSHFKEGEVFVQYSLPTGKVREYLLAHGVKWWIAGVEMVPVDAVKGEGASLSMKLETSHFAKVDCQPIKQS